MTAPNREAVEALARKRFERECHPKNPITWETLLPVVRDMNLSWAEEDLTAALPFLAPQPSGSDEELARVVSESLGEFNWPLKGPYRAAAIIIAGALAAVRAEATLAGAAAAKEAIANWIDETSGWDEPSAIAAAIRARKWT